MQVQNSLFPFNTNQSVGRSGQPASIMEGVRAFGATEQAQSVVSANPQDSAVSLAPVSEEKNQVSDIQQQDKAGGQIAETVDRSEQVKQQERDNLHLSATKKGLNGKPLSLAELGLLVRLQQIDRAVRGHEQAHLAAAGSYARSAASFSYARGPDGRSYAVGGEVQIDTSPEAKPEQTIAKMMVVRSAALAPADPSPQDRQIAAQASVLIVTANQELRALRIEEARQTGQTGQTSQTNQTGQIDSTNKTGADNYSGQQLSVPNSTDRPKPNPVHAFYRMVAAGPGSRSALNIIA